MESRGIEKRSAPTPMSDDRFDEILASARRGDGEAFAKLYGSMNRRVYAFVSFRGAADPEGTVNDVFLKVFTSLETFDGNEMQFAAWIFRIARNRLIDESRSRNRRPDTTPFDNTQELHGRRGGDVELDALDQMSTEWVLRQLDVLTPEQRDVVAMRVIADLTIEAIAEVLGKRVGAVKAMQRRAFRTLAKNFDNNASKAVPQ